MLSKSCLALLSGITVITSLASSSVVVANPVLKQETQAEGKNTALNNNETVSFQLKQCGRNNKSSKVICSLLVTNVSKFEDYLTIGSTTILPRVFDSDGNEYKTNFLELGSFKGQGSAQSRLIKGIPVKLLLTFEILPEVSRLTVLEVSHNFRGNSKAEFRDVGIVEVASKPVPAKPTTTNRNRQR